MKVAKPIDIILGILIVILLFIIWCFIITCFDDHIQLLIQGHVVLGKVIFFVTTIIAALIPIVTNLPFIPIGTLVWGPFETAILCILGWLIGSCIAFTIGRYGETYILSRYPKLSRYQFVDEILSTKYKLLSLIFLRITIPGDILSYMLGMFSKKVSWQDNAISTFIGIIPFAFIFAYIGLLSPLVQIITTLSGGLFLLFIYQYKIKHSKRIHTR